MDGVVEKKEWVHPWQFLKRSNTKWTKWFSTFSVIRRHIIWWTAKNGYVTNWKMEYYYARCYSSMLAFVNYTTLSIFAKQLCALFFFFILLLYSLLLTFHKAGKECLTSIHSEINFVSSSFTFVAIIIHSRRYSLHDLSRETEEILRNAAHRRCNIFILHNKNQTIFDSLNILHNHSILSIDCQYYCKYALMHNNIDRLGPALDEANLFGAHSIGTRANRAGE
jgi:hypothetical protein